MFFVYSVQFFINLLPPLVWWWCVGQSTFLLVAEYLSMYCVCVCVWGGGSKLAATVLLKLQQPERCTVA